jgi:hypothetical protein
MLLTLTRHMSELRRYVPILIAGGALIAAACVDTASPTPEATSFTRLSDRSFSILAGAEDANAQTQTFVIEREGNTVRVGEFTLRFDPDAVCALDSGYGDDFWQQHCAPLGHDLEITATIFTANDRSYVEFSPDIRFNPDRDVTISVVRTEIIGVHLTKKEQLDYDLWYTKRVGNTRLFVDESWRDPELLTQFNTETGRVWREIRHFSGIVIHVGYCTDNPDDASCAGGNQY